MRKVAAAVLAVPVLAIIYLPVLARRPIAARAAILGTIGIVVAVAAFGRRADHRSALGRRRCAPHDRQRAEAAGVRGQPDVAGGGDFSGHARAPSIESLYSSASLPSLAAHDAAQHAADDLAAHGAADAAHG